MNSQYPSPGAPGQPAAGDPLIGQTIGNYLVTQKLGEGGMGSVYLAEHPHIGKKVALKVLHAEFASNQEVVSRFFNEAKAVNDIQHPNIVDIIDYGVLQMSAGDALVYFIMEFLPGITLTELIRREAPLAPERALTIALQVADALSASHKSHIVHRDLKPDNIILIQRGREHDFVKLLDFGIAKLTGDQPGSRRTRTGIVMGTPAYMSPEQCEGRGSVDHRTDIYALGIVLYEMITGKVPFTGDGYGEILVQHLTQMPAPPSTIRGLIPPHVEAVVMKALHKRPDDRYPTMDEFMRALADPVGYVEAHGGIAGFQQTRLLPSNAPIPAPQMMGSSIAPLTPLPGSITGVGGLQTPTTLGGSAGQVGVPGGGKRTGLFVGLGVGVVALGVGAVLILSGGSKSGAQPAGSGTDDVGSASGSDSGSATAGTTGSDSAGSNAAAESNAAGSNAAGSNAAGSNAAGSNSGSAMVGSNAGSDTGSNAGSDTVTPPKPDRVTVTIESTPKGASVFYNSEKAPRCRTPCHFKVDKAEQEVPVSIVLYGYDEDKRTVSLASSPNLDVALKKKSSSSSHHTTTHHTTTHHTTTHNTHNTTTGVGHGDDTINPFDP
jgi:serine/threonine protein kinase